MPLSAVDAINPAFEHARKQLFQPFRFGQWTRLAFVGLLAGELGSGGCNFSFNHPVQPRDKGTDQWLTSWHWPSLAMEGISATEGWRRLWARLKLQKSGYAGYIGMKLVLAIAAGIAFAIVILTAMVVLLIPIGAAAIAAVLGAKAAGFAWNFYTIALAVVIGLILLAGFFFVSVFLCTPPTVFFLAYAIYFFPSRYPPLAALAPVAPVPRFDPPPLPPTPAPLG